MKYENIKSFKDEKFRQVTGITQSTFSAMLDVLKIEYAKRHAKNGRHRKLSIEDMLLATLEYLREYRAYECIAASYGISKQNMCLTIRWVEETLVKSGKFSLPGKKSLAKSNIEWEVVLVDTTETPIQRPTRGQKQYYSGKKNDIH